MSALAPDAKAQEFNLRAPGPDHTQIKYFVGKFSGGQPEFSAAKSRRWSLSREPAEEQSAEPELARTQPWLLQDGTGTVTHRGHLEGGLGGASSSAGYFILIKEGSAFTALPTEQFYTFRPKQKFKVRTLEEAEQEMDSGQQARKMANSRLAALVANEASDSDREESQQGDMEQHAPVDEEDAQDNNMEAEPSGSDREEAEQDDIEQHAPGGRRTGANASSAAANGYRREAEDNADPDVTNNRDGKREDWEHEEERQDDDVDMEGEEAEDGDASPAPPQPGSGERDGGQRSMITPEKTLQRMLNTTGLSSESDAEADSKEEEDDEDDEPDLDALATRLSAKTTHSKSKSRSATPSGSDVLKRSAAANKRKADGQPADSAKRAKPSTPAAAAPAPTGEVTEAEIVDFMRGAGPIPSSQLTSHFRKRVVSMEQRKAFTAKVKKLAKLQEMEPGKKCIVLR